MGRSNELERIMSEVYQIVTDRIIDALNKGIVPWRKPWKGDTIVPTSFKTRKPYRGVNRWLLDPSINGFTSGYWMTYKQATELGGQVRKGSKGSPCVFWKIIEDRKNPTRKIPLLRQFTVFNLEQVDGIAAPETVRNDWTPIEQAEAMVNGWNNRPTILENGGDRCFYRPATDTVSMASKCAFCTPEAWYATLFHELVHSTGHQSRLDRLNGSEYAREELVAELGAAFLCAETGISNAALETNTQAYIEGWLKVLHNDPRMIVSASGAAQRAVDMIKGVQWNDTPSDTAND
jgi:antirestriction protein ArdC